MNSPLPPEPDPNLERLIHRELRSLPDRAAPRELAAGVLARIAAQNALPWWQKPWLDWPGPIRLLSFALALTVITALGWAGFAAWTGAAATLESARQSSTILAILRGWMTEGGEALTTYFGAVVQQYWMIGLGVMVSAALSCVGLGTVFFKVLFPQRQPLTA